MISSNNSILYWNGSGAINGNPLIYINGSVLYTPILSTCQINAPGACAGALSVYDNSAASLTSYANLYYSTGNTTLYVPNLSQTSDERLKTNIVPISNALNKISSIQGVYYSMIGREDTRKMGFIAQNVEESLPELVHTDAAGYKSLEYANMTAPLVASVNELYSTVLSHDSMIESIKEMIATQQSTLQQLQSRQ
jgi:hypothetical protein